jgi:hypothetical protein
LSGISCVRFGRFKGMGSAKQIIAASDLRGDGC